MNVFFIDNKTSALYNNVNSRKRSAVDRIVRAGDGESDIHGGKRLRLKR